MARERGRIGNVSVVRIHHTGMVVRSLQDAYGFYRDALSLRLVKEAVMEDQGVKAALFDIGNSFIELLEPIDPDFGIARFLETRGEGLHHVCLEVADLNASRAALKAKHIELIVSQMLRKVRVENPGDTNMLPHDVIDRFKFRKHNQRLADMVRVSDVGDTDLTMGDLVEKDVMREANAGAESEEEGTIVFSSGGAR